MRVAVVGAHGQLGAAVVQEFAAAHEVLPLGHEDLDVTSDRDVAVTMERLHPEAIINCVGFNDVDGAEDRPVDALNLNALAVRALARAAAAADAVLVHYSTNFVFDGSASAPYAEDDHPNPRSAYAASKLLGEWFACDAPRAYVLRVASLFGRAPGARPAKGSIATMLNTLAAGGKARVFEDLTVSPMYVMDGAYATRRLIETQAPFGIYHCVNSGSCTWLEFGRELASQMRVDDQVTPVRMADVQTRAARPRYAALSNRKLAAAGVTMPSWQDAIGRYLVAVRDDLPQQVPNR